MGDPRRGRGVRYSVSGSAGQRDGKRYAVLDRVDRTETGGMRRVSFHRTFVQAKREAKRLNDLAGRRSGARGISGGVAGGSGWSDEGGRGADLWTRATAARQPK